MERRLAVALIQPEYSLDTVESLSRFKKMVDYAMAATIRPEMVIGVEFGLGRQVEPIPGPTTQFLSELAIKHRIYLIPGTMLESAPELPEGQYYNTCPVFAPDGKIIATHRKMVPFRPGEPCAPGPSDRYCVFEIPEKNIKVGVQVCYDQFFPEIARTLALMGAELIVTPSMDTVEFEEVSEAVARVRAMENQAYYIWTNGVGTLHGGTSCGRSIITDPMGKVVIRCGNQPSVVSEVLDFQYVTRNRWAGKDQHLNSLRHFHVEYPFADRLEQAPLYEKMPTLADTAEEHRARTDFFGIGNPYPKADREERRELDRTMNAILDELAAGKKK